MNARNLFLQAKRVIPGGVNSPVRAFQAVGGTPIFIRGAAGSRVVDEDEREYIDYIASWLGGDPDLLGEKREYWSNATLQSMLGPNSSMNRTITFSNNGDTGSYRLYYTLYRE